MLELDKKETYISDQDKDMKHLFSGKIPLGTESYAYCGYKGTPKQTADLTSTNQYCQECVFRCSAYWMSAYGIKIFK